MIRSRRVEDLDRLCAVLDAMEQSASLLKGQGPWEWLQECDAELSWVFDMVPVRVTPTKNVVGHAQVYRVDERDPVTPYWVDHARRPAGDLLAIGKLFVRADTHEHGIGRYLLLLEAGEVLPSGLWEMPRPVIIPRSRQGSTTPLGTAKGSGRSPRGTTPQPRSA